jgi:MoxR-like ATPase
LDRNKSESPVCTIGAVLSADDVLALQNQVMEVKVNPVVRDYILQIVDATRHSDWIMLGASPRGSIALYKASKALAFINDRDFVTPDDVRKMTVSVLAHRMILTPKGKSVMSDQQSAMEEIINNISVPINS